MKPLVDHRRAPNSSALSCSTYHFDLCKSLRACHLVVCSRACTSIFSSLCFVSEGRILNSLLATVTVIGSFGAGQHLHSAAKVVCSNSSIILFKQKNFCCEI